MLTLTSTVRICVAAEPVDRSGFDGLAAATREIIRFEPLSGHLFAFLNRRRNRLKILLRYVVFRFASDGTGEKGPWNYLQGREGYVQADASNVFDRIFNDEGSRATEVGCLAHVRRKLHDLLDSDARVAYP